MSVTSFAETDTTRTRISPTASTQSILASSSAQDSSGLSTTFKTKTAITATDSPTLTSSTSNSKLATASLGPDWAKLHDCVPYSDPDFRGNSVCQCDDGTIYPQDPPGNCDRKSPPTATTAKNAAACEFDGPTDCAAATAVNYQSIISAAEASAEAALAAYNASELGNCTTLTYHTGDPGPDAQAKGGSCSDVIPIAEHMRWWWDENQEVCHQNGVNFTNCFYDRVPHYISSNCTNLNGNFYCQKPDVKDFTGANKTIEFYVAWNIYNFSTWIYLYYDALFQGGWLAGTQVWNDSTAFEHLDNGEATFIVEAVLGVLTFALGLISPSGWATKIPVKNIDQKFGSSFFFRNQVPGEYVLRAVQQNPGLTSHLLSTGNINDALISANEVEAQLGGYISVVADSVASLATDIPNNVTAFIDWTANGFFFNPPQSQNEMMGNIKQALNTYVLSQLMQNDNLIIVRALDTNPYELARNASNKKLKIPVECNEYNEYGMCNSWWYDKADNIAYSLYQVSNIYANFTKDLTAVFEEGLTTPEALFLGSQYCSRGVNATQGQGPLASLNDDEDGVSTACLSSLQVCTWNMVASRPEFVEEGCPSSQGYEMPSCASAESNVAPVGFLGYDLYAGMTCAGNIGS